MPQANGENLRQAMDALRTHKLRSALTIFGVVLGVSVIMLVAALITGFDAQIQENVKQFGADTAFVTKWDQGRHGGGRPRAPPPREEGKRGAPRSSPASRRAPAQASHPRRRPRPRGTMPRREER